MCHRSTDDPGHWTSQNGGQDGDGHEGHRSTDSDEGDRSTAEPGNERADAGGQDDAADNQSTTRAGRAVDGDCAHRRDRWHAPGPAGGDERRGDRDDGADYQACQHRAQRDDNGTGGDVDTERREEHLQQTGNADAGRNAGERREQTDDRRLDENRAGHLSIAGTERTKQRHLLLPLGDDDRERVEDDERTDEQGDHGEDHQERVEEGHAILHVTLCLGSDLGPGQHLCAARQDLGDAVVDLLLRHAVGGDDSNTVDLTRLGNEGFGSRGIEQHGRGPTHRVGVAERGDAADGELLAALLGEHRRHVADVHAGGLGRMPVDDDLVGPARAMPLGDAVGVQFGDGHPRLAERRSTLTGVAHGIARAVDELGVAADLALGCGDPIDVGDGVDDRGVEAGPLGAELGVELGGTADVGIGAGVAVGEQTVEGPGDGGGEHQGARHEGHAEHHGDGSRQEPQLLGGELS